MTSPITSWLRAFVALQESAIESRGVLALDSDCEDGPEWPRTNGSDVVAIAAIVDPHLREQPIGFCGRSIERRWNTVIDSLAMLALDAPHAEYVDNRAFWSALPAVCAYLHAEHAPLPDEDTWTALLAELSVPPLRNVGPSGDGPFAHFDGIKTYDDLYRAQYVYLRDKRGADEMAPPPGQMGTSYPIPRTTNADVMQLATYWSAAFAKVKHVDGHDAIAHQWQGALADVDKLAKPGKPDAVYAKNNEFWRELKRVAIQTAVADESPTSWDQLVESVKDSITHLPDNLAAGAKKIAHEAANAAHAVGQIANEAGKGLFSGFGTPLLIGAGLVGLFLITRARKRDEEE